MNIVDFNKLVNKSISDSSWINNTKCKCCGRKMGLPRGNRGLCDGCDEDIPDYIPEEQFLTYMKEYWRKK